MWVPVGAGGDVDDGVAAEEHLLGWPDHVGEGQRGVREHAVAERGCCLHMRIQVASSVRQGESRLSWSIFISVLNNARQQTVAGSSRPSHGKSSHSRKQRRRVRDTRKQIQRTLIPKSLRTM